MTASASTRSLSGHWALSWLATVSNWNHIYTIPGCVYNPDSPLNILGVTTRYNFFKDSANSNNAFGDDGTIVKSDAIQSHLVWDHIKHKRHFLHGSSNLPELCLYASNGYFTVFCTHMHRLLYDKVYYTFSSAYYIEPTPTVENTTKPKGIPYEEGTWMSMVYTSGMTLNLSRQAQIPKLLLSQTKRLPGLNQKSLLKNRLPG